MATYQTKSLLISLLAANLKLPLTYDAFIVKYVETFV